MPTLKQSMREKLREGFNKAYFTGEFGWEKHRNLIRNPTISDVEKSIDFWLDKFDHILEEKIQRIGNLKTRDGYGAFRHIEVYKDEVISILLDKRTSQKDSAINSIEQALD